MLFGVVLFEIVGGLLVCVAASNLTSSDPYSGGAAPSLGMLICGLGFCGLGTAAVCGLAALLLRPGELRLTPAGVSLNFLTRRVQWTWDQASVGKVVHGRASFLRLSLAGGKSQLLSDAWDQDLETIRQALETGKARWGSGERPAAVKLPKPSMRLVLALGLPVLMTLGGFWFSVAAYHRPQVPPYDPATGEPHVFAALAASRGEYGRGWGRTLFMAERRAQEACARQTGAVRCRTSVFVRQHQCAALAAEPGHLAFQVIGPDRARAVSAVLARCNGSRTGACRVLAQICADDLN